jgi:FkbM family methyltransferase
MKLIRNIYHTILSLVLRLFGMDFSWYRNFYVKWPYAVPVTEVFLQKLRPRKRSEQYFARYDITRYAAPGDTVLDLGANIGAVSSHLLSLGFRVEAWEPDSRCVEFLRRRFSRAGGGRITVHHEAVSNHTGTVTLNYGTITTESNTILEGRGGASGAGAEEVPVRSIRDILDSTGYVPLIKMDIEGAEYDVLDVLLAPEYRDKFGLCLVECHAGKIPSLEPRHRKVKEAIERLDLGKRVYMDWD